MTVSSHSSYGSWLFLGLLLGGVVLGYGFARLQPQVPGVETSVFEVQEGALPVVQVIEPEEEPTQWEEVDGVSMDDDTVLGDPNAPIVMVEFSDFQCPYCQRFHEQTFPDILENYIETGLVQFVYRDFPLNSHENALVAAEAAECASDYWAMHDWLFGALPRWSGESDPVDLFVEAAESIGEDGASYRTCLESGAMTAEVEADLADGLRYGVEATPTFYVNGLEIVGAESYENFVEVFEALLEEVSQ